MFGVLQFIIADLLFSGKRYSTRKHHHERIFFFFHKRTKLEGET